MPKYKKILRRKVEKRRENYQFAHARFDFQPFFATKIRNAFGLKAKLTHASLKTINYYFRNQEFMTQRIRMWLLCWKVRKPMSQSLEQAIYEYVHTRWLFMVQAPVQAQVFMVQAPLILKILKARKFEKEHVYSINWDVSTAKCTHFQWHLMVQKEFFGMKLSWSFFWSLFEQNNWLNEQNTVLVL